MTKKKPFSTSCFDQSSYTSSSLSHTLSLPVPVPEALDAYINVSKTILKQGEALTVNCTVQGVELVLFSWETPNHEVSRSEAEQDLLFGFPFVITLEIHVVALIASRCRDTPRFLSLCEIVLETHGDGVVMNGFRV